MKNFFNQRMGFGRYANKTIGEVFANNRPYFDQVLHKNAKFMERYALAFHNWKRDYEQRQPDYNLFKQARIYLAIELVGEEKIKEMFLKLIRAINQEYPDCGMPEDLDYRETIEGKCFYQGCHGPQYNIIALFWSRIAVPEI